MSYFINYPNIRYNSEPAKNLLVRSQIIQEVFDKYEVYYPYTVKDGETPDFLAYQFYENPELSWVIYYSNKIIDPLHQWVLGYREFNDFLRKKYNSPPNLLKSVVSHYKYVGLTNESKENIETKDWKITTTTWDFLTPEEKSGWAPVFVYDDEFEKNEEKRNIRILQRQYIDRIRREIGEILT